jgi:hypothetical protein
MGSIYSSELETGGGIHHHDYERVVDIPIGTAPPSLSSVQNQVMTMSCLFSQKYDPLEMRQCRECLTSSSSTPHIHRQHAEKVRDDLSAFQPEDPDFSEKTYRFKRTSAPEVWISSTKNSDQTISYWFQYPILPFHIQAAMLSCMRIPITRENLQDICERYEPLYTQLLKMNEHEVSKCEQVEPLYVDMAIRSLIARGYQATKGNFKVE